MTEHQVQNWYVRKPLAHGRGGVVTSQNRIAAREGARVLARGGNAVDAAVTAAFALAAVEPWNSGLGGIGFLLFYSAKEDRVSVVDFGPVSAAGCDPARYPLVGGGTTTRDLFTWPSVKDDCNVHGPLSFAVPGQVDGLGLALERFGTLPFSAALVPAVELAEEGIAVDWFLTLKVATAARELARYPTTRDVWLPHGFPPVTAPGAPLERLKLPCLADTLKRLAAAGRREFYEGSVAAGIVRDVKALGGVLAPEDLRAYQARIVEPLVTSYRGVGLALTPGLTAGPSMRRALHAMRHDRFRSNGPHADAFIAYARVLREAYQERLATMGETAEALAHTSTTHLNVIDRQGNMVALTQTLLSVFGSKVVLPSSGILMNNGMMWFDPRPGTPNCIAPNKRPLTNMCPVLATREGAPWFAIGASGGRKIFPAVMQICSFLIDHDMHLEDAFHQPRIDASGGDTVTFDPLMPFGVREALAEEFTVQPTELVVYPTNYACPSAVLRDAGSGENFGVTDIMSPWSGAVSEEEA
jgi:gamma-glutamyltranspeptidase / glutathione hydrolase